jgi:hypothetical protein
MKDIGHLENFKKIVLHGTSHTVPEFNPFSELVAERYEVGSCNYGVVALGIESYFPRIHGIINKHQNENILILAEIPKLGRYQEYKRKEDIKYKSWSMVDNFPNFWNYKLFNVFIEYYNISKLDSGMTNWDRRIEKSLLKLKIDSIRTLEEEDLISKIIALNALITSKNHKVLWFSFDNYLVKDRRVQNEFKMHNVELITQYVLDTRIRRLYNYNDNSIYENKKIYVDGFHASPEAWKKLFENYFYDKLDKLLTKKIKVL